MYMPLSFIGKSSERWQKPVDNNRLVGIICKHVTFNIIGIDGKSAN